MRYLVIMALVVAGFSQQPAKAPKSKEAFERQSASRNAESSNFNEKQKPAANSAPGYAAAQATAAGAEQAKQNREDVQIRRKLVWFAGFLVVVGLIQAVVLGWQACVFGRTLKTINRQARIMLRQTKVARQSAQAARVSAEAFMRSQSAFIYFPTDADVVVIKDENRAVKNYEFYLPIENSGNTQTVDMRAHVNVHWQAGALRADFAYPDHGGAEDIQIVLAPKAKTFSIPLVVGGDVIEALQEQRQMIYFYGWASYKDIFFPTTPIHRTEFCYQLARLVTTEEGKLMCLFNTHHAHNSAT